LLPNTLNAGALRGVEEGEADGHSDGGVVALEGFVERVVIVVGGEQGILRREIDGGTRTAN